MSDKYSKLEIENRYTRKDAKHLGELSPTSTIEEAIDKFLGKLKPST